MAEGNGRETPPANTGSTDDRSASLLSRSFASLFYNPLVARGVLAISLAVLLFLGHEIRGPLFKWALPIGLLVYSLTRLWELWRLRKVEPVSPRRWVALLAAIGVVTLFIVSPEAAEGVFALAIAVAVGLSGAANLLDAWRYRDSHEKWPWMTVKGLFLVGVAVLVVMFPQNMLSFTFIGLIVVWIAGGIIAVLYGFRGQEEEYETLEPSAMVLEWLSRREYPSENRHALIDNLFFEGDERRVRLNRFAALMAFSIVIATLGILQDSTAVVIGAMLIAPLMTPIMALAAAIVMGWRARAGRAAATIALAVFGGILLAALVAVLAPVVGDALQSSQVISRTSPTLLDLLVALTAGAAGAFAMSRPDVSDSLPGVAIAVALVPPLGVVGVTLAAGDWGGVAGSFLLFMTNFVSIVLAGSVVFILTGFSPIFRLRQKSSDIRVALGTFAIFGLIIAIPLSITGQNLWETAQTEKWTGDAVAEWLEAEGIEHNLNEITVSGDEIDVLLGIDDPNIPEIDELADIMVENGVETPFTVTVHYVPEKQESHTRTSASATVDERPASE